MAFIPNKENKVILTKDVKTPKGLFQEGTEMTVLTKGKNGYWLQDKYGNCIEGVPNLEEISKPGEN